ncbi:MAG: lysophospholipid acyltransferase family protein [Myxococcales bacterium]|nr:1-acyl-sn-glycerol-3-phosphate acyltransferase [Polyangiaceae bacterium]MDW8251696.1 lysophospholipid acyltransferase family protein [Myxococcales bacterium]
MTSQSSLRVSLRLAEGLLRVSGVTLLEAAISGMSRERFEQRIAWWARRVVEDTQINLRVEGREHLVPGESFIIMSNHQSHLDIPILFHAVTPAMRMVAKKELFRFPIFGQAMREAGFIEVDRQNRAQAISSLRSSLSLLREGLHVWIAPEGTRSVSGELLPFKKGGFWLALEAGVRILPVALHGTRDVLPVHAIRTHLGRSVGLAIDAPLNTQGKDISTLVAETYAVITALHRRAKELAQPT